MRYAKIDDCEICNGSGVGVSLFVQGCHRHCKGCFNSETWDFNGGKEWNDEVKNQFLTLVDRPYIQRVTLLGGEALAFENQPDILFLIRDLKNQFPDKKIWLYTGYTLSENDFEERGIIAPIKPFLNEILRSCDVIVDGEYKEELRDLTLAFRGSSNQRLIDVKKTIQEKTIILWGDNNGK